jgi:dihydroflavonol-4-reductase
MTVVVTGAGGHLAANLIRMLLKEKRHIRAVVRSDKRAVKGLDVETVQADVLDPHSLKMAFKGAEVVYHLAALVSITGGQSGMVARTNVEGVRNVVDACLEEGVDRMIHFSSIHAHRQAPLAEPLDERRPYVSSHHPNAYDRSKAGGEEQILNGVERGLNAVIINPTAVIGPWDFKPSPMGRVFLDLYHGRLMGFVDGGFDWVDARDVALGAMAAEAKGRAGQKYLLSGHWKSLRELAEIARDRTGMELPSFCLPLWLAQMATPLTGMYCKITGARPLFTRESIAALRSNRYISCEKARRELGYDPRPIENTVKDIFDWLKEAGRTEA